MNHIASSHAVTQTATMSQTNLSSFIWSVADLLRGDYKQSEYGKVIPQLARDLRNELPEVKGFSETNLKRMTQFFCEYPELRSIGAQRVPQLKVSRLATFEAEAKRVIELLHDRLNAVMSEAVTSKIDDRGFVKQEAVA